MLELARHTSKPYTVPPPPPTVPHLISPRVDLKYPLQTHWTVRNVFGVLPGAHALQTCNEGRLLSALFRGHIVQGNPALCVQPVPQGRQIGIDRVHFEVTVRKLHHTVNVEVLDVDGTREIHLAVLAMSDGET
jgi:hypothetical protein